MLWVWRWVGFAFKLDYQKQLGTARHQTVDFLSDLMIYWMGKEHLQSWEEAAEADHELDERWGS